MLSRSTLIALAFASLATLSVAVAADLRQVRPASTTVTPAAPMAVIDLPRVVVTGRVAPISEH